jgi:hypothetical protein
MVEIGCPVDGCDFTGNVDSVEGHISGAQSGDHGGEVGRHFREELIERAEVAAEGGESGDASETNYAPEGSPTATSSGTRIAPSTALIVASVVFGLSAFAGSTSETATETAADQDGEEPDGGLIE